ncbi:hypothetical protein OD91_2559 [Lutibacter sp. Hel_I_33_5]|uniref:hypothetical protein n=1 Tax=Lutibacter sp. Hel_I_33_5 TaxID=1566289 RepID=UPI00119ECA9C|nr:hypothetical protein [Lutibacter sp. Hel_I_33_5]TVZ57241.1 hypothetical protein OD91_2559 [Lutibacter sp. Hel_I_33_5]
MKKISIILFLLLITSCNIFDFQKKKNLEEKPLAEVNDVLLYKKDIVGFFPKKIDKKDSVILLKSLIDTWALKNIMLKKADDNSTQENVEQINKLVKDYRESLLINNYKERLIKQQLDTIVSEDEVFKFYKKNSQNFRLNEELIKIKYLTMGNDIFDKEAIIEQFKSDDILDREQLENQVLSFKKYRFNDSTWISLDNVLLKIPFKKEILLKKSKFTQKEDSLGLYLVAVKDVLKRNSIAPLSYIKPSIKQMVLHQRKLELIREIEKIILKDAVQNKDFTIY